MMNIAIFSTQIGTQGTGPEVVDRNIISTLSRFDHENNYIVYYVDRGIHVDLGLDGSNFRLQGLRPGNKWAVVSAVFPFHLLNHPVDVLHATFVAPLWTSSRFVFTLTCWSQYERPEFYPKLKRWRIQYLFNRSIRHASAIICVSDFVKERLLENFPVVPEKVFVTRPGVGKEFHVIQDRKGVDAHMQHYGINDPFILYAGTVTKRKNVKGLIRAYSLLRQEKKINHKLVIATRQSWIEEDIFSLVHELKLASHVLVIYCDFADMPWFYNGADLFVFPSFYEGYGMPPSEAMACGTPVVTSNVSALPEATGGAAFLVDPTRPEDIAEGIYRVLNEGRLRADLIQKGIEHARRCTWEKAGITTLEVYRQAHLNHW